jgi:hypothetical protein
VRDTTVKDYDSGLSAGLSNGMCQLTALYNERNFWPSFLSKLKNKIVSFKMISEELLKLLSLMVGLLAEE